MGINLFNVPGRVTKNEMSAQLWRTSMGYKMSRKAKKLLNIPEDKSSKLAIGTNDNGQLIIAAVSETEQYNSSVNGQNMIQGKGMINKLDTLGNRFHITNTTSDGGYIMTACTDSETSSDEELAVEPLSPNKDFDSFN